MFSPTVVLIDDDPVGRELTRFLIGLGVPSARVIECANGRQGLNAVRNGAADLVITDNSMSDLPGLTLTRQLRVEGVRVPIILHTASHELEREAKEAGVTVFLPSTDTPTLPGLIRRLLLSSPDIPHPA